MCGNLVHYAANQTFSALNWSKAKQHCCTPTSSNLKPKYTSVSVININRNHPMKPENGKFAYFLHFQCSLCPCLGSLLAMQSIRMSCAWGNAGDCVYHTHREDSYHCFTLINNMHCSPPKKEKKKEWPLLQLYKSFILCYAPLLQCQKICGWYFQQVR